MTVKKINVEKLIRDKLPEILRTNGIVVHERVLDDKEYFLKLKEKLLEEAEEVKQTESTEHLEEELADVLEVVNALAAAGGLTMHQIEKKQAEKRQQKGGFAEKRFVSFMERECVVQTHQLDCIFCQMALKETKATVVKEFEHCFAIYDQYPVAPGHVLIIPYEHTENWFTASDAVRNDIVKALTEMKDLLDAEYQPQGYNVGANCGAVAGQTVMHLHVHLIPRYLGDMEDPKGGVRGVIPSKQKY
jgi:diadenosine tetraphosphate (Ap4A) HIT family hydrolase/predicted house-cleaning noncanonical NTP pyrophosphatase (MazG superfamily)